MNLDRFDLALPKPHGVDIEESVGAK
jgi:hypothetical protein